MVGHTYYYKIMIHDTHDPNQTKRRENFCTYWSCWFDTYDLVGQIPSSIVNKSPLTSKATGCAGCDPNCRSRMMVDGWVSFTEHSCKTIRIFCSKCSHTWKKIDTLQLIINQRTEFVVNRYKVILKNLRTAQSDRLTIMTLYKQSCYKPEIY